jgi:hypothetical protein
VAAGTPTMILEELLDAGDPRFWDELLKAREPAPKHRHGQDRRKPLPRSKLTGFADKWVKHPSDFARRMLLRYVDDGCDRLGQRPLVRRILALAEEREDRELLAHLVVAFDRLIVLRKQNRYRYDVRQMLPTLVRVVPSARDMRRRGERPPYPLAFTGRTRQYLRRRALRPFRMVGYRDNGQFIAGALEVLSLYEDRHLDTPEKLIASYSLLRLLHANSDVLTTDGRRIAVRMGKQLAELSPAPMHPDAWAQSFDVVYGALPRMRALFVRRQVALLLERTHAEALTALDLLAIRPLLRSQYADLAALGARLLARSKGGESLPVKEWLALAEIDDPTALAAVAERMAKVVLPARVTIAEAARLAISKHGGIAELGTSILTAKAITRPEDLAEAMRAVSAPSGTARSAIVGWLTTKIVDPKLGTALHLRDLLDARYVDARAAGLALLGSEARFADDTTLWAALSESPYDDARTFLLKHLDVRAALLPAASLSHLWATTLLAVHRGSRAKQGALRAIGDRIAREPVLAEGLLPLLALALRSVRETERRGALASLVRAAARAPSLRVSLATLVPELSVTFDPNVEIPPLPARASTARQLARPR